MKEQIIKVLDLNILEGGLLFDELSNFLMHENPDILCLQEVFDGKDPGLPVNFRSIQELRALFPRYWFFFSPEMMCITTVGKIKLGNLIMSKYPIVGEETTFFDIPYGEYPQKPSSEDWSLDPCNIQHGRIQVDKKIVNVFNLHGIWGRKGDDTPRRLRMSEVIVEKIKETPKTILTGDFNTRPQTKTIQAIEAHLNNLFSDKLTTTFNLPRKDVEKHPGYATATVDMMFVSFDIGIIDTYCPRVDVSDHLPLVANLRV